MKKRMLITAVMLLMGIGVTTTAFANNNAVQPLAVVQEEVTYDEIKAEELPETVTTAIQDAYSDYTVSKAFLGSDSSYKVELTKEEEKIAVFFSANGEFLKVQRVEE